MQIGDRLRALSIKPKTGLCHRRSGHGGRIRPPLLARGDSVNVPDVWRPENEPPPSCVLDSDGSFTRRGQSIAFGATGGRVVAGVGCGQRQL